MAVDYDNFYEWAKGYFGAQNLKIRKTAHGVEICAPSFFAIQQGIEEHGHHLWMNTEGGKKKIEGGAYRCWKTDAQGSLISLVADCDGVSYDEAEEALTGTSSFRSLEQKVHEFFGFVDNTQPAPPKIVKEEEEEPEGVQFPDYTFLIDRMDHRSHWRIRARRYLSDRKIPSTGLFVCTEDKEYGNRIIIPWYDRDHNLIFWNGRTMSDNKKILRYTKPKRGDQEHALFMTDWPEPGTKVYLMEGEFDAITLGMADFTACACGGKSLSDAQINMLRGYQIVLAFDADESGKSALVEIGNALLERGFSQTKWVRPPVFYKDWNKLLQERNIQTVKAYVERFEKPYTTTTADDLLANRIIV